MFRNPRENKSRNAAEAVAPSVGRAPSPHRTNATPPSTKVNQLPPTLRQSSMTSAKTAQKTAKITPVKNGKPKPLANGSILSFFSKQDKVGETLFVQDSPDKQRGAASASGNILVGLDQGICGDEQSDERARFNESPGPSKRRKLSTSSPGSLAKTNGSPPDGHESVLEDFDDERNPQNPIETQAQQSNKRGGFLDDSDSDDDDTWAQRIVPSSQDRRDEQQQIEEEPRDMRRSIEPEQSDTGQEESNTDTQQQRPPLLRHASTSIPAQDGFDEFDDLGDFEDDYEEGEEYVERRFMQEQARLEEQAASQELAGEGDALAQIKDENDGKDHVETECSNESRSGATCPICTASLAGVSDSDASIHVNNCLDGKPTPLPKVESDIAASEPSMKEEAVTMSTSFKRLPRPPKPAQKNPFELGNAKGTGSAFSKLMSGHAEDAAWADAAAEENKARGKPAYQRTCPFYKILPGFSIAVDAFRYGAVQGASAYFLSHFHSDHYVGLTQTWSHGPIYCSKPTANLVKQQLRVNPKFVVALEWEKKIEVPGTQGVFVTMIPANHCPGSSLYLFEKVVGKGASPKVQRVLHCGDFRACPAHVKHPLLMPEVRDAVTGKTAQQRIDVCYLDTTYCNPKWAFPSQEDVIAACADMCISLNKEKVDKDDGWEKAKKERAGGAMAKFVRNDSSSEKIEPKTPPNSKCRGKLLVVVGTYSIGKERIALGIARALKTKIFAPAGKQRICHALEDQELLNLLTTDPYDAQVHLTPLFEIRAETLEEYLKDFRDRFSRAVGFRPTGWNYRPPGSRFTESPSVTDVLHSNSWKSTYSMKDLIPQRGSNNRASCFGVPYSEHSSFRELTMFCCALRIDKIIPTVNVGSAKSRERMKVWCERWAVERKKNGLFQPVDENGQSAWYPGKGTWELRTTL